jgi:8-oxo-dGTP pyrophosphatase MutT (NUDIX family)
VTVPAVTVPAEPPASLAELRARVAAHLGGFAAVRADGTGLRRAAVAVCVVAHRGEPCVVVIKRAATGRHAGQWALPGGRIDGTETVAQAAVRELAEEVALTVRPEDVLGALDDFVSVSGFVISPVVIIPGTAGRLRRNPAEVHSIHPVPLRRLLDPAVPRWRAQPTGDPLLQLPLRRDMVIHAPTGAILWQFREVALSGRPRSQRPLREPAFVRIQSGAGGQAPPARR